MATFSLPDWQRLIQFARAVHVRLLHAPPSILLTGLGCMALAASSDIANTFDAPRRGGPTVALLLFLALIAAFSCFLLATRLGEAVPTSRRFTALRLLIYPVLLWSLVTAVQTSSIIAHGFERALTVTPVRYGSDDLYYNHYNALLVLHGKNPYTDGDLASEIAIFGDRAYTPIARGQFADPRHYPTRAQMDAIVGAYLAHPQSPPPELDPATLHSYPAGAFLVALPAVWAGVPSIGFTQVLLLLAVFAVILWMAPPGWRLVVGFLLLSCADGAREVSGADFEIWPLALVAFAWLSGERRWLSALLLGAACAIKQTAWLAAPFYLVWVWRRHGLHEAGRRAAIAGGAFLAINAPWIVASPRAWLTSLALPVSLPLVPDGSGIIGLSLTGVLPLAPHTVYAALELLALVGALVWYWRTQPRFPFAGLVLALLPLLFAWRSSERYFVLLPIAAIVALVLTLRAEHARRAHTIPAPADITPTSASAGR